MEQVYGSQVEQLQTNKQIRFAPVSHQADYVFEKWFELYARKLECHECEIVLDFIKRSHWFEDSKIGKGFPGAFNEVLVNPQLQRLNVFTPIENSKNSSVNIVGSNYSAILFEI